VVLKGITSLLFKIFKQFQLLLERLMQYHRPLLFEWFMWTKVGGMPLGHVMQVAGTSGHLVESLNASVADPCVNHFVMFE